jgi:type II secretory pathway component GspD/PulD (secretin)
MNAKKVGVLIGIISVVALLLIFIPFERIYIKKSEPIQYMPDEKPVGLIEAYNNYIVLSYGTLLKQNQEEFFSQVLKFDSSDYASSHFSKVIEAFKKLGLDVNLTSYNNMQKAIIITNQYGKERYSISVLKENKIFYIAGDKTKIEKVVEWLVNQKS